MAAEGVATHIDQSRILNEQVAMRGGVNAVASQCDAIAPSQVYVIFLTADDVAGDGEETRRARGVGLFLDADICPLR